MPSGYEVRGARNHLAGAAAEDIVRRDYEARGYRFVQSRFRGTAGEIDLIFQGRDGTIFVEVKKARSFDGAVERILPRQIRRIMDTACEFVATLPTGLLTDMRFDVALVNHQGETRIIENAFCEI